MSRFARLTSIAALAGLVLSAGTTARELKNTAEVLRPPPSINVFRRFDIDAAKLFAFYSEVLGFRAAGSGLARGSSRPAESAHRCGAQLEKPGQPGRRGGTAAEGQASAEGR